MGPERAGSLSIVAVPGIPEVEAGDDPAELIHASLAREGIALRDGDVLAVASKIVSKARGLRFEGDRAAAVEAETVRVIAERLSEGRLTRIVVSAAGPVMAAAGVDESNSGADPRPLLLPREPDREAAGMLGRLLDLTGLTSLAVVVTDTVGRPWRVGQVDFALGSAGLQVVDDLRGGADADGRPLAVTIRAVADEVAAAADLVKGKHSGTPVAIVRGLGHRVLPRGRAGAAAALLRTGRTDWFALGPVEAVRAALGVPPGSPAAEDVGIPDVAPEPHGVRLGRAVALALHGLDDSTDLAVDVGPESVTVTGFEEYAVGWLVARLTVALAAEDLRGEPDSLERGIEEVRATLRVTAG